MTIVAIEDSRNVEWRKSNKGSAMLQKMGWNEGQGIGKRANATTTALRALKRREGLGLGAKIESQGGDSQQSDHFSSVLKSLKEHHAPKPEKEVKKDKIRKKKEKLILAQNRVNAGHARKLRESKFGERTEEDLKAIFGSREVKLTSDNDSIPPRSKTESKRKRSGNEVSGEKSSKKSAKRKNK